MVPVKHILLASALILLAPASSRSRPDPDRAEALQPSLFAQALAQALNRDFSKPEISFLLLDVRTGALLASRWEEADLPIPLGSLAKPFAALAYGDRHDFHYPSHICRGSQTGCWRPGGHGQVDLASAIAYSCNSYFRMLTQGMSADDVYSTATHFGIELPDKRASGIELAGLGPHWKISPLRMARAYIELLDRRHDLAVAQILVGMERSARDGTGAEVDRALASGRAMAKTGTAVCTHFRHAPGDGFAIVLAPEQEPRFLLMVRIHGAPGSQAAKLAGQMLHRVEE